MNTKTETPDNSTLDTIKLVVAIALLIGGIGAYYWFAEQPTLYRVIGILLVVIVAAAIASATEAGRALWDFVQEARVEVRKVVWPTRQETTHTTLIVIGMVLLASILLWLIDLFFGWGFSVLTGQGG